MSRPPNQNELRMLAAQLLLGRTEGLSSAQLAVFLDGWTSLLGLVRRTDLTLPGAPREIHDAIAELVRTIQGAQDDVLPPE